MQADFCLLLLDSEKCVVPLLNHFVVGSSHLLLDFLALRERFVWWKVGVTLVRNSRERYTFNFGYGFTCPDFLMLDSSDGKVFEATGIQ
jgi:hypothetical protein